MGDTAGSGMASNPQLSKIEDSAALENFLKSNFVDGTDTTNYKLSEPICYSDGNPILPSGASLEKSTFEKILKRAE